jgi:hypothetical protein
MDDISEGVIEKCDNLKVNLIAAGVTLCATGNQSL